MKYKKIVIPTLALILSSGCATMERCDNMPEGIRKDYCLKKVAVHEKNAHICDEIDDEETRNSCYDKAFNGRFKGNGCTWGSLGTLLIHVGSAAASSL